MKVTLHGEELDFTDDRGIRSHCMSHAIAMVKMLPSKRIRKELEKLFADVYFVTVKAGGALAYYEYTKAESMPVIEFSEIVGVMRMLIGMGEPDVTNVDPTKIEVET